MIERTTNSRHGQVRWNCYCSCDGREVVVTAGQLRKGGTLSCGCYQREASASANRTHGQSGTRLYRIWKNMLQRAANPNSRDYAKYGGVGHGLDDPRWRTFEDFAADMADGYRDGLTLDRIDGTKGYSKANCRWATYAMQNRNTSQNRLITFRGITRPLADWAEALELNSRTLTWRLNNGWSIERALTTAPANRSRS
ncbi:hypothetical protein [Streptomyces sp. NPDC001880]